MRSLRFAITLACSLCFSASLLAQTQDRAQLEKEFFALRAELAEKIGEKEKQLLAIADDEKEKHKEFLQQPETGLVRLLPREKFDGKLNTRGGGAYFSFTRLKHEYGHSTDIALEQGRFSVGFAGANFGFLRSLSDTPIEELTLNHIDIHYAAEFVTPSKEKDARLQYRLFGKGLLIGEALYRTSLDATLDTTYVLRSIDYGNSDVLVIFRAVKKDTDGSMLLLLKKLKTYEVPKLERTPEPEATNQ